MNAKRVWRLYCEEPLARLLLPAVGALIYYATYLEFRNRNAAAA